MNLERQLELPMMPGAWAAGAEEVDAAASALQPEYLAAILERPESEDSWVRRFEASFASAVHSRFAVATSSGTTALLASLGALGVNRGDEVIVPAYGYVSCVAAVRLLGAEPVIVDVNESLTVDPAALSRSLSRRTRAVIVVHMRGVPADMSQIRQIADAHRVAVVEDAAQACGATYGGVPVGCLGTVGCFSLHPTKMVSAGEGGVVVSDDAQLMVDIRTVVDPEWRDLRSAQSGTILGLNLKLGHVAAAVASVQLGRLDELVARMAERHAILADAVDGAGLCARRAVPAGALPVHSCLIFFTDGPRRALAIRDDLRATGIRAHCLYDRSQVNSRVSACWPGEHDGCPASMALLERGVHIDVNPHVDIPATEFIATQVSGAIVSAYR